MLAGVLLAGAVGCGVLGSDVAGGLRGDLEDLPGVRAASVERRALDTDYYAHDAVADMEPDATTEQVAEVLDRMARWRGKDAGEQKTTTVYVGAGTTRYDDGWMAEGPSLVRAGRSHEENMSNARLLLAARDAFDHRVSIFGDGFGDGTQWRVFSDAPVATAREVLADPVLAAAPRLLIEGPRSRFGSVSPLRKEWVAAYSRAVGGLPHLAGTRTSVMYFGSPMNGEDFSRKVTPDQLEIILVLQVRKPRLSGLIAEPAEADPRWSAVRSQLDVMKGRAAGSHLAVWLQYDPIGNDYRRIHDLVDLTLGKPVRDGKKPSWNDEAAAYLVR